MVGDRMPAIYRTEGRTDWKPMVLSRAGSSPADVYTSTRNGVHKIICNEPVLFRGRGPGIGHSTLNVKGTRIIRAAIDLFFVAITESMAQATYVYS